MTPKRLTPATARLLIAACRELQDRLGNWMEIAEPHDIRNADMKAMQHGDIARLRAERELTRYGGTK